MVPHLMATLPEMFIESETSESFSTCRELYVTICDAIWFFNAVLLAVSVILLPVTRSVTLTALSTQICCV
jgi:hypothetical protein